MLMLQEHLMLFGIRLFKGNTPGVHICLGESRQPEKRRPQLFGQGSGFGNLCGILQEAGNDALLFIKFADLSIEIRKALFKNGGYACLGRIEEPTDILQGDAGLTIPADLFEPLLVLLTVIAILAFFMMGGREQADGVVIEQRCA
jgi:hypothetical protein